MIFLERNHMNHMNQFWFLPNDKKNLCNTTFLTYKIFNTIVIDIIFSSAK